MEWISIFLTLYCLISICVCMDISEGGILQQDYVMDRANSPYTIKANLLVAKDATLEVQGGVVVKVRRGVMIAVNGTLLSKGTKYQRILFTRESNPLPVGEPQVRPTIRLVNEESVKRGQLQLFFKGKWRAVCIGSKNWTSVDVKVTCQSLGFSDGRLDRVSWPTNNGHYVYFSSPACEGTQRRIEQCRNYANAKLGAAVCDKQKTIHLQCYGLSENSKFKENWWGMEFYNTSTRTPVSTEAYTIATSTIEYTTFEYAGVDPTGEPVAGFRASPHSPHLLHTVFRFNALDAVNASHLRSPFTVLQSEFSSNKGHGLVAESAFGDLKITGSKFTENGGDGIHAKLVDSYYPIIDISNTFCKGFSLSKDRFPLLISGVANLENINMHSCFKRFTAPFDYNITVNVLEMNIEPNAEGSIEVYDSYDLNPDKLIATFKIINGTLPQGITTKHNVVYIKFYWKIPFNKECPTLRDCVKFTLMLDSGKGTQPEFRLSSSHVSSNQHRGISLENIRNLAVIQDTDVLFNEHEAGLRVFGGAGDLFVSNVNISHNADTGVNVTYDGGWRVFRDSTISGNHGNGVNITLNETRVDNKTRYSHIQRTEISYTVFEFNEGVGLKVGNYCHHGYTTVNDSRFHGNAAGGVEFFSCDQEINSFQNFTIGYSTFVNNKLFAIRVSPLLNAKGRIANNTFTGHRYCVIDIDNHVNVVDTQRLNSKLPVEYSIEGNEFYENSGVFVVNIRLTDRSSLQNITMNFNVFRDNSIREVYMDGIVTLNKRLRCKAVVIISSVDVSFKRNSLTNRNSRYEICTHFDEQSVSLPIGYNWWGTIDYGLILLRVFDQAERYNLARLTYHPVLETNKIFSSGWVENDPETEIQFDRGTVLGGRLYKHWETTRGKSYFVDRDINVMPGGALVVNAGSKLLFSNAIAIIVQGRLDTRGSNENYAQFTMANETLPYNETIANLTRIQLHDITTTMYGDIYGRLMIRPKGHSEWGTVCNEGWSKLDAAIACQQIGLVLNPDQSKFKFKSKTKISDNVKILRNRVRCSVYDDDITECPADNIEEHSCQHRQDVFLSCVKPTWGGIRFTMTADRSSLDHLLLQRSGLFDPTLGVYVSAVTFDYNRHSLLNSMVFYNMAHGVEIRRNEIMGPEVMRNNYFLANGGAGLLTKTPFLDIDNCKSNTNRGHGILFDPSLTIATAVQMKAGIRDAIKITKRDQNTCNNANCDVIKRKITLDHLDFKFFSTDFEYFSDTITYEYHIAVIHERRRIMIDIIDYNPAKMELSQNENITFYNSPPEYIHSNTQSWSLPRDASNFPIQSADRSLTFRYTVKGTVSGRLSFIAMARQTDEFWPAASLTLTNCSMNLNTGSGYRGKHYDDTSNRAGDIFSKYAWFTVAIQAGDFLSNQAAGIDITSSWPSFDRRLKPEHFDSNIEGREGHHLSQTTYSIEACNFTRNHHGAIRSTQTDLIYSTSMWIYEFTENTVYKNLGGGLNIVLPKVNLMYETLLNHSVDINNTMFRENEKFQFNIDGFYCNSSVARNIFDMNKCGEKACISISGTEKDFFFVDNVITSNQGHKIMDVAMSSHTPYTRWVSASIEMNQFLRNTFIGTSRNPIGSYALAIRGLQNITVNRNLFENPKLDYELIGGYQSSSLESYLDVTLNWWGTRKQTLIHRRIFDFTDWNSYAIAEYYPYLEVASLSSMITSTAKSHQEIDLDKPLGGRFKGILRFTSRSEPYIIASDLNVMEENTLFVDAGVVIQFYPNVGILVLGKLTMIGTEDNPIILEPVPPSVYDSNANRVERSIESSPMGAESMQDNVNANNIRLIGENGTISGLHQGFLQVYNTSEHQYSLLCDSNFDLNAAQVACRQLQLPSTNVLFRTSRWYDTHVLGYPHMHNQVIEDFWRDTFICDGSEENLDDCRKKENFGLPTCMHNRLYVYLMCFDDYLPRNVQHWGNIRFSATSTKHEVTSSSSTMKYVNIRGAGILHGRKVAAVQCVYSTPTFEYVNIKQCAWNGFDFIAPLSEYTVYKAKMTDNAGYGFGGMVLNGDSNYDSASSFVPLVDSHLPFRVFGMINMCTTEKLIKLDNRLLLYYKYGGRIVAEGNTVDCIKIIQTMSPVKKIALRFLQIKFPVNTFYPNSVSVYRDEYFEPGMLMGVVDGSSTIEETKKLFLTDGQQLSLRLLASIADDSYGFVVEISTMYIPEQSNADLSNSLRQHLSDSVLSRNLRGAVNFETVGELNPPFLLQRCQITDNGYKFINETGPPIIQVYAQNMELMTIANNYLTGNHGDNVYINTTTSSKPLRLYSNITNNVHFNNDRGSLYRIEGHPFQEIKMTSNYMQDNNVAYRNLLSFFGINLEFNDNILTNNVARTIINGSVHPSLSVNQYYTGNSITRNQAIGANQTTMFFNSANFKVTANFLLNRRNKYELVLSNRTKYYDHTIYKLPHLDAKMNWWGQGHESFVRGRIIDRSDDDNLVEVDFKPFHKTNSTILSGRCLPGWFVYKNKCFRYMGGVSDYKTAVNNCKRVNARIAWASEKHDERHLTQVIVGFQLNYDRHWRIWVHSDWQTGPMCSTLIDYRVEQVRCDLHLSYICELDPYINPSAYWRPVWIILIVVAAVTVIVLILVCFAVCKSRLRRKQHFERRASLRASIRSSRQTALNASIRCSSRGSSRYPAHHNATTAAGGAGADASLAGEWSLAERASGRHRHNLGRPSLAPRKHSLGVSLSDATLDCSSDSSFAAKFADDRSRRPSDNNSSIGYGYNNNRRGGGAQGHSYSKSFDGGSDDYSMKSSNVAFNNNGFTSNDERPALRQGYKPYNSQIGQAVSMHQLGGPNNNGSRGGGPRGSSRQARVVENEIANLPAAKSIPQIRGVIGGGSGVGRGSGVGAGIGGRPALPLPVPLPAHIVQSDDERSIDRTQPHIHPRPSPLPRSNLPSRPALKSRDNLFESLDHESNASFQERPTLKKNIVTEL